MVLSRFSFWEIFQMLILPAFFATLRMVLISGVLATLIGMVLGIVLVLTDKDGLSPNRVVFRIFDVFVNIIRSFPFIILIVTIIPLTRLIVGSSIGEVAALVPLTVACSPFMGRIFQNAFKEVDPALIEAAKSAGADYAVDVYPHYGSDVEATLSAGSDIRHGLIGPGVYASHGYERSHLDGVYNTLALLTSFLGV